MNTLKLYYGRVPACGVFCGGCPTYTRERKPCPGADKNIKRCEGCTTFHLCCQAKGISHCYECHDFPCKRFKSFAKRWLKYGQDFIENQKILQDVGADEFLRLWNDRCGKETHDRTKIDHKKALKHLYGGTKRKPAIVDVPPMNYLMIDGKGHPDEQAFQDAVSTLYPVAYTAKFMIRKMHDIDYTVMPLEVKWTLNRQEHDSIRYSWTMMLMQPEWVTQAVVQEAAQQAQTRKELRNLSGLRLECLHEGLCGQIMHKGPYAQPMEETFNLLKAFLTQNGYQWEPDSHDIYFNNVLKTKPENLKTLIRVRIWR